MVGERALLSSTAVNSGLSSICYLMMERIADGFPAARLDVDRRPHINGQRVRGGGRIVYRLKEGFGDRPPRPHTLHRIRGGATHHTNNATHTHTHVYIGLSERERQTGLN